MTSSPDPRAALVDGITTTDGSPWVGRGRVEIQVFGPDADAVSERAGEPVDVGESLRTLTQSRHGQGLPGLEAPGVFDRELAQALVDRWAQLAAADTLRPLSIALDLAARDTMPRMRGMRAGVRIACLPEGGGRGWGTCALVTRAGAR